MNTNFPLIRITSNDEVRYLRTFNWNRTGVQTGTLLDTVYFNLPYDLPIAKYQFQIIANGISSQPTSFEPIACNQIDNNGLLDESNIFIYPNPSSQNVVVLFKAIEDDLYDYQLTDLWGRVLISENYSAKQGVNYFIINVENFAASQYVLTLKSKLSIKSVKLQVN